MSLINCIDNAVQEGIIPGEKEALLKRLTDDFT